MNTPTPTPITDKAKIAFTSLFVNDDGYCIPYVVGVKLERELTAVTEQRDSYKDRFESLLKRYAIETHQLTEQRDRLAEDLERALNATVLNHRRKRWHIDAETTLNIIKLNQLSEP